MKKIFLLIYLTGFTLLQSVSAQTCASTSRNPWEWPGHNNWGITTNLFSGNMLNFDAGTFTVVGDAFKPFQAYEGVSGASDDQGNLIFWTNGRQVLDKNLNVTYAGLLTGNENGSTSNKGSASQGVITVRHPLNPNRYYIFTVDDALSGTKGLNYAVMDENGALVSGSARLGNFRTTEGITATFHENEVDIWIAVQESGSTNIHAFLLRCDGVVTTPVTSGGVENCTSNEERGGLAFNWTGTKLLSAHPAAPGFKLIELDFNKATGVCSNPVGGAAGGYFPYDATYSPDNSRILFSDNLGTVYSVAGANGAPTVVAAGGTGHSAIEIGGDGLLYRASLGGNNLVRLSGNMNGGGALSATNNLVTTSSRGLPTMYIPPAEEPIITPVGPFCNTDDPVNLQTVWMCSGKNAEDTVSLPISRYAGPGIIYPGEGIFDPKVAGPGTHEIIFTKCAVDDTIFIVVNDCASCEDTLKNITPELCPGSNMLIDTLVKVQSAAGVWTIDSVPTTAGTAAVLVQGATDTLFDATALTTKPGTYKLMFTVTDGAESCKDSIYIKVNALPVLTVNKDTICEGDPAATFTSTVDSTVVTYNWTDNGTGSNPTTSGIIAGNYSLLITDNHGCTARDTGVLIVNKRPVVTVENDTICSNDAAITFTAVSDSTVATYTWSGLGTGNASTTPSTTAGTYTVAIVDVHGCKDTASAQLIVNTKPVVNVENDTICSNDAAITFTAVTDSTVVTHAWSGLGTGNASTAPSTTAGTYTVAIVDVHGCKDTASAQLIVNTKPVVTVENDTICSNDAAITFTAVTDSTVATHTWSGLGTGNASTTPSTTAGTYTVAIVDVHGCKDTASAELIVNTKPIVTVENDTICSNDAAITFTAVTDSTVATHTWSGLGTGSASTTPSTTAGTYTVAIVDVHGCKDTASAELIVNTKPVVTVENDTICSNDAAITFTAVTDSTVATHTWSGLGTGNTSTTPSTTAGTYTVAIVDVHGCKDTASAELIVNTKPVATVENDTICTGESAVTFTAVTDSTVATHTWSGLGTGSASTTTGSTAGTYTVAIVDVHGCKDTTSAQLVLSGKPVVTLQNDTICEGDAAVPFTAVSDSAVASYEWMDLGAGIGVGNSVMAAAEGTYTVAIVDVNSCKDTVSAKLVVNALPVVSVNSDTICAGEVANVFTATVDSVVDTYLWGDNGAGNAQTTPATTAGIYTVVVTDVNGCIGRDTGVLIINALPVVTVNNDTICDGDGAKTFTAAVDSAVSLYAWTGNGTGVSPSTSGTTPGNYIVEITDIHGCIAKDTGVLVVNELPTVVLSDASVCPNSTQTLTPVITGGKAPFEYLWSTNEATATIDGGSGGNFSVVITDDNGCIANDDATVSINNNLTVIIDGPINLCAGEDTTLISNYKAADGYNFVWSLGGNPIGNNESVTVNTTGTYALAVDKAGCTGDTTVDVTVHALPTVTVADQAICLGEPAATFTATSATATNYIWSENGSGIAQTTTGTTAGNYTVIVKDVNQCADTATGVLTVNSLPTVTVANQAICAGDLAATFTATSATATTYVWSVNGSGSAQTTTGTTAGNYTVIVQDALGCADTATGVLTVNAKPTVTVNSPSICEGETGVFTAVSTTATSYAWSGLGTGTAQTTNGTTNGDYTVEVTDANGCKESATGTLTVNPIPVVVDGNGTICSGDAVSIGNDMGAGFTYAWQGRPESTYAITVSSGGSYVRTVTSAANCSDFSTYTVDENSNPVVNLTPLTACDGTPIVFEDPALANGYSYSWSTGETTASISTLTAGSYTLTVTNTTTNCVGSGSATATFIPIPVVDLGPDHTICEGDQVVLDAGNPNLSWLWSDANRTTTQTLTVTDSATYYVDVMEGSCISSDTVKIHVIQYPISALDKSVEGQLICMDDIGGALTLLAGPATYRYLWNTGDTINQIDVSEEGIYNVQITNRICSITDQIKIDTYCPWTFYVPNAFTPDGDFLNDVFYAYGTNIKELKLYVYDRWGLRVFESNDMSKGWDGRYKNGIVQQDVYVWKAQFIVETESGSEKEHFRTGTVTVVK